MTDLDDHRSLLALGLGLLMPGLGHTVHRRWLRSFVWFMALVVTVTVLLLQAEVESVETLTGLYQAVRTELDVTIQVGLLGLHLIQAVDAYTLSPRVDGAYFGEELD